MISVPLLFHWCLLLALLMQQATEVAAVYNGRIYGYEYTYDHYQDTTYVSMGSIVGAVIGVLCFFGFVIGIIVCVCCRARMRRRMLTARGVSGGQLRPVQVTVGTPIPTVCGPHGVANYPKQDGTATGGFGSTLPPPYPGPEGLHSNGCQPPQLPQGAGQMIGGGFYPAAQAPQYQQQQPPAYQLQAGQPGDQRF